MSLSLRRPVAIVVVVVADLAQTITDETIDDTTAVVVHAWRSWSRSQEPERR